MFDDLLHGFWRAVNLFYCEVCIHLALVDIETTCVLISNVCLKLLWELQGLLLELITWQVFSIELLL